MIFTLGVAAVAPAGVVPVVVDLVVEPQAAKTRAAVAATAADFNRARFMTLLCIGLGKGGGGGYSSGPANCGGRHRRRRFSSRVINPSATMATTAMITIP